MKHTIVFLKEYIKGKLITYHLNKDGDVYFDNSLKDFNHKRILSIEETNSFIIEKILSRKPFMVGRFGATELATVKTFDFELKSKYAAQLNRVHMLSGFFPETDENGKRFTNLMINSIPQIDLIGIWPQPFEEYYTRIYGNGSLQYSRLRQLEPWLNPDNPWSAALKNKRVLVVHPFTESIVKQYEKRENLFPGTEILPEFDLQLLKSVQTSGGGVDDRFNSWFDAYEWMRDEILRRDFDIAILGCGAYGFPLAADIKKAGRQAIHLGGATQLLFGIMGTRWESDKSIQLLKNDDWIRPLDSERPIEAGKIENAAYW